MTFPTISLFGYGLTAGIGFVFTKASGSPSSWSSRGNYIFLLAFFHLDSQTTMATKLLRSCELVLIKSRQSKIQEEGSREENAWSVMWIAGIFSTIIYRAYLPWVSILPADTVSFIYLYYCCLVTLPCFYFLLENSFGIITFCKNSTYRSRGSAGGLLAWGLNTFLS